MTTASEMVRSGGLGEGNTFTIAASTKAFEVLSSNLYQNKILAVIREISCNAADAHKMAGRPLSNIQVHVPTYVEPWFAVRDFGPSLTHDAVLRLYTTYFLSTKDQNDDLIGGFGLGSKAPFAVADQFTVTTWRDGIERRYVCYKQDGVPNINFIGETETTEPTGLEVRVAVPTKDIGTWTREGETYFAWWPELPAGIKATSQPFKHGVALQSSKMVDHYPEWAFVNGVADRVVMGLVPYAINYDAIPNFPSAFRYLTGSGLVLSFGVGELSISPSRETLSYDPKTCAAIIARLKAVHVGMAHTIEQYIGGAPTLYEARIRRYSDDIAGAGKILGKYTGPIKWRGKDVAPVVGLEFEKEFKAEVTASVYQRRQGRKLWAKPYAGTGWTHSAKSVTAMNVTFYAEKITAGTYRRVAHYMETKYSTNNDMRATIFSSPDKQELDRVFNELGLPALIDVASLPAPATPPRTKSAASKTKAYTFDSHGGFQRTTQSVDLTGGGTFVRFVDGALPYDNTTVRTAIRIGLLPDHTKVIGISSAALNASKTLQATLASNNWKEYDLKPLLAALPKSEVLIALRYDSLRDTASVFGYSTWQYDFISSLRNRPEYRMPHPTLAPLAKWLHPTNTKDPLVSRASQEFRVSLAAMYVVEADQIKKERSEFTTAVEAMGTKHPLLKYLRWDRIRKEELFDYLARA